GDAKPLIYDEHLGLIYLYRYWQSEQDVAHFIKKRVGTLDSNLCAGLEETFKLLFERGDSDERSYNPINWQEVAAFAALQSKFCVISGGPGTGKTTTVAKILTLLLKEDPSLRIDLVAPTGKAADRLKESIRGVKETLPLAQLGVDPDKIPNEASTIHRYLKYHPNQGFRYNSENKRNTNLLLVDEASMVSVSLFSKLFSALEDDCRVILLGDKDQLASVDNGNVLGDITSAESINQFSQKFVDAYQKVAQCSKKPATLEVVKSPTALDDAVIKLEFSFRFKADSGIGVLSKMVNEATTAEDSTTAFDYLSKSANADKEDVFWSELPGEKQLGSSLKAFLAQKELKLPLGRYKEACKQGDAQQALKAFGEIRVLCAVNEGVYGVLNLNELLEKIIFGKQQDLFYVGRPIIVTQNDHNLKIYNGDIGVILKDKENTSQAYFLSEGDGIKQISPAYLPDHQTAFATTIHKSQGSEFNTVLMVLPDQESRLLTKEIIYTGITRAKENITVWSK
ncbi:MAG: exodeoxyribonuclease V subunit alpha, partial [Lentisphaeria bacterium]|nr:exodeoxyribonuclease V subunit alpha [Lentisphaeria bacterium]